MWVYIFCKQPRVSQCMKQWVPLNRPVKKLKTIKCFGYLPEKGFRNGL